MATFQAGTSQANYTLKLDVWENSLDSVNNKSNVGWSLKLISSNYNFYGYGVYTCVDIAGQRVYEASPILSIDTYSEITIAQGSLDIYHDDDGSKNIGVYAKIEDYSAYYLPGKGK